MITVGEYFGLSGEISSARVNEVDAGKVVLSSHILGTQMFLHGDGVVAAALHRRIVSQYHALLPANISHDNYMAIQGIMTTTK